MCFAVINGALRGEVVYLAPRSNRQRIKHQGDRLITAINNAIEHLAKLDAIADERSPHINEYVPRLLLLLDGTLSACKRFRDGL